MIRKYLVSALLVAALLATATSCHHTTDSSTSGFTTLMCDKTFENIIQQEIDVFEYTYPNASIIPYYIDAHSAIDSMLDGNARLIITAQELSKEQMDYLQSKNRFPARSQRIAVDAIAVIVNKDNDIDELSISELRDILSGKTPRWKDVFPSKLDTIRVIFDHPGSSIYKYVKDSIMRGEEFGRIYSVDSLQQVFTEVERRRNAIGFIGVSWITADLANSTTAVEQQETAATDTAAMEQRLADLNKNDVSAIDFTSRIKVMKIRRDDEIEGYKPYQLYIYDGRYPLFRSVYVTTTEPNGSLQHGFYSFLSGFIGQKIILNTGVMPAIVQPRVVSLN